MPPDLELLLITLAVIGFVMLPVLPELLYWLYKARSTPADGPRTPVWVVLALMSAGGLAGFIAADFMTGAIAVGSILAAAWGWVIFRAVKAGRRTRGRGRDDDA